MNSSDVTGRDVTERLLATLATPMAKGSASPSMQTAAREIVRAVLPDISDADADRAAALLVWAAFTQHTATLKERHLQAKLSQLLD